MKKYWVPLVIFSFVAVAQERVHEMRVASAATQDQDPSKPRIDVHWTKLDQKTLDPVDTCLNRDAEQGFATWSIVQGYRNGANGIVRFPKTVSDPADTKSPAEIMPEPLWDKKGNDPHVDPNQPQIPVVFPNGGKHTFRLGNDAIQWHAEAMYQAFVVTPQNADFSIDYAIVLQKPGNHLWWERPFMGVYFFETKSGQPVLLPQPYWLEKVGKENDPFFYPQGADKSTPLVWRQVSCVHFDLSKYIGEKLIVMYVTSDCSQGGHYGYAYFDGKCGPPDPPNLTVDASMFCPTGSSPVTATASSNVAAVTNTWTIVQTDSSGANANASTLVTQTFNGAIQSPQDLSALYASGGQKFECGKYYRVTLTITTECGTNSATKVVYIACPSEPIISGPVDVCTNGTYCVKPQHGIIHTWSVQGGTPSSTTGNCISVTWGSTGPYSITVTATSPTGCKITKTIAIKPCDCCKDTKLKNGQASLTGGANGLYSLSEPLTLTGFGPVTQVTATIVSVTITPNAPGCGTAGPVAATIASGSAVSPFNGPLLNTIPGSEISWTSNTPVNINGQSFPFQIQLPAPPPAPCADVLSFCVRYTFTGSCGPGQAGCRSCSFVVCHRVIRSCDSIIWPDSLIMTLTNQLQQELN